MIYFESLPPGARVVSQYTLDGRLLCVYPSVRAAATVLCAYPIYPSAWADRIAAARRPYIRYLAAKICEHATAKEEYRGYRWQYTIQESP